MDQLTVGSFVGSPLARVCSNSRQIGMYEACRSLTVRYSFQILNSILLNFGQRIEWKFGELISSSLRWHLKSILLQELVETREFPVLFCLNVELEASKRTAELLDETEISSFSPIRQFVY